jgi:hypothetical protein
MPVREIARTLGALAKLGVAVPAVAGGAGGEGAGAEAVAAGRV